MAEAAQRAEDDGKLDVADLRAMTIYDPATGAFVWRTKRRYGKAGANDLVGVPNRLGYRRVQIDGRRYQCHRLIWLYVHGVWPDRLIDHINGDPSDNRLENLRLATRSENAANKKRHRNGASGFKGASKHAATGLWQAQIMVNGRKLYLGLYSTPEAAHQAYVAAARQHFEGFARAA